MKVRKIIAYTLSVLVLLFSIVAILGIWEIATGEYGFDLGHLAALFLQEAVGGALLGLGLGYVAYRINADQLLLGIGLFCSVEGHGVSSDPVFGRSPEELSGRGATYYNLASSSLRRLRQRSPHTRWVASPGSPSQRLWMALWCSTAGAEVRSA